MEDLETPPPNYTQEEYLLLKRETERSLCGEYEKLVSLGFRPNRSKLRQKYTIQRTEYPCKTTVNQWINKLSPIKPVGSNDASDLEFLGIKVDFKCKAGLPSSDLYFLGMEVDFEYKAGLPRFPERPQGDLFEHIQ